MQMSAEPEGYGYARICHYRRDSGWRDGNACTTHGLRGVLDGAYTGREWLVQVSKLDGPWVVEP